MAFILSAQTGNSAQGKQLFEGKGNCLHCHSVNGRGGSLGPDLSQIGVMRTRQSLRLAITDPNAEIYQEYFTVVVETKAGQHLEGIALNEDDISIQLRDMDGNPRSFLKDEVNSLHREERSLMPAYAGKLMASEIDDLVYYLRTLRGTTYTKAVPRTREIARVTENFGWLTRPERVADERPDTLVQSLEIREGSIVADLGSGSGFFTWRLADKVGPRGKVLAVDVQGSMLDLTMQEVRKHGLKNVQAVLGTEGDPKLQESSVDLVFIANSYHEFAEPEAILAAVRRSLKPDGRLVVIEYAKENTFVPVATAHKMTIEEMRSEIEPAGFELERILDFLPMQHGLIFTKRAQDGGAKR
jgi:putative heme-binding domain-containing protein